MLRIYRMILSGLLISFQSFIRLRRKIRCQHSKSVKHRSFREYRSSGNDRLLESPLADAVDMMQFAALRVGVPH